MTRSTRSALFLLLIAASAAAYAQTAPPTPLPGLDDFSLPASRPTPRPAPSAEPTTNPRPAATPTPRPAASAAPRALPPHVVPTVRATPTPFVRATPAARPTSRPVPTPTPTASPDPLETAQPVPSPIPQALPPVALPTVEPTPVPLPTVTRSPAEASTAPPAATLWPWLILGGVLLAGALAAVALWWRRHALRNDPERRDDRSHELFVLGMADAVAEPSQPDRPLAQTAPPLAPPAAMPPPPVPPAFTVAARATLDLEMQPKRAGTNLLSASVEYTIVIRNVGEAAAIGVRLDVRLLSAGRQQDAQIAALFAAPINAPATAPFDLPPGTQVELGGMAMHPKDTLERLEVEGKALFVPVLAVNVGYAWDGGRGQTALSYVVGVDRAGTGKLQPFRLDGAARMYDTVGALAYTVTAVR